jgi:hypothetical protein
VLSKIVGDHAPREVPRNIVVANPHELADRIVVHVGRVRNQDDRCRARHHPADPGGESRAQLDVIDVGMWLCT